MVLFVWTGRRLAGAGERLGQLDDAINELQHGRPSFDAQERPCDPGWQGQENQGERRDNHDRGYGDVPPAQLGHKHRAHLAPFVPDLPLADSPLEFVERSTEGGAVSIAEDYVLGDVRGRGDEVLDRYVGVCAAVALSTSSTSSG